MVIAEVKPLARVQSIWGISQLARKDKKHAELLMPYLSDSDDEIRAQVVNGWET
jgi:hypothetical protein